MAEEQKTRIINLAEKTAPDSGDFFAVDSQAGGSKKIPATAIAKAADLTAEASARTQADNALTGAINSASALIQNPTKTLSGALCSFTDGADMPMVACTASITPKQSGTGTPSPSNVRPISGWESVNLRKSGKNLLKNSVTSKTISGLTCTRNEDGTVHITGTATNSIALNIAVESDLNIPSGTYIVSGCPSGGSSSTYRLYIGGTDENGSGFGTLDIGSGKTVTVYSFTTIQIQVFPAAGAVDLLFKPMIRLTSDTDPTYEPYTGTTTTVNLGRTVYGADAEIVGGSLTDKMAMVDLGTLAWGLWTGARYRAALPNFSGGAYNSDLSKFLSSALSPKVRNAGWDAMEDWQFGVYDTYVVVVKSDTTASDLKTALNGVQLVYPVATPQTYTLTPTEVKTLLGENNVWADSGDVEITYRRDISIVLENLENALNGSNSLNAMMMSAPTENTAEEPTADEAEDDMR